MSWAPSPGLVRVQGRVPAGSRRPGELVGDVRTHRQVVWARTDWGLVIAALGASLVGALLVHSATRADSGSAMLVRHLLNLVVGLGLAAAVTRVDFRTLRSWWPALYGLGLLGLVAVIPLGTEVNGARSWIFLPGGMSLQPAEMAKVGLCLGMAGVLGHRADPTSPPAHRDVILAWVLAVLPIGLIMLQPDLGSVLVYICMAIGIVTLSGASWWWVGAAVGGVVAAVTVALTTPVLDEYQRNRLLAFADPSLDPSGIGYQTRQVRIAIGSGGFGGQGLYEGRQTQGGLIPEQQTDFIFSVAGEELGYVGTVGLLALLGFIMVRALVIALRTHDMFVRLTAVGVACWFLFQVLENVGMNLGLMPVTGLPLPFVSYGGSSMFAGWLAVGLLNTAQLSEIRR